MNAYDVIIIGAGSIGTPAAFCLAQEGIKTLVLDSCDSPGQCSNKTAIGGVRATHSDPSKIRLSLRSLEILSTWNEVYGDNIEWNKGGYLFVAYGEKEKKTLKKLLETQKQYGLKINWISEPEVSHIIKGINRENLLGGSYSPDDGSTSPLLTIHAFYRQATRFGADFHFNETVNGIQINNGKVNGVTTNLGTYKSGIIINAAGPWAKKVSNLAGVDIPVIPDSHEAAITEPTTPLLRPLVVDIQPTNHSANFYFYQNQNGQIIFCMTPDPLAWGTEIKSTPDFLPLGGSRLNKILPKLRHLRVYRTWRGLYPMTPDGFPIVGWSNEIEGYLLAVGLCGQGLMLAPGVAELLARLVKGSLDEEDHRILSDFSPNRDYSGHEALK
jgi:sarcosine oxidase, subunit beta